MTYFSEDLVFFFFSVGPVSSWPANFWFISVSLQQNQVKLNSDERKTLLKKLFLECNIFKNKLSGVGLKN